MLVFDVEISAGVNQQLDLEVNPLRGSLEEELGVLGTLLDRELHLWGSGDDRRDPRCVEVEWTAKGGGWEGRRDCKDGRGHKSLGSFGL